MHPVALQPLWILRFLHILHLHKQKWFPTVYQTHLSNKHTRLSWPTAMQNWPTVTHQCQNVLVTLMTHCETTGIRWCLKTSPVTFTASPTKQWAGTHAKVLKSKRGKSVFKIKHSRKFNKRKIKTEIFLLQCGWHKIKQWPTSTLALTKFKTGLCEVN